MNQALTSDQLKRRLVAQGHEVKRAHAAMFLGYWLEQGIVTEVWPNRFALTDYGMSLAVGLEPDTERKAA